MSPQRRLPTRPSGRNWQRPTRTAGVLLHSVDPATPDRVLSAAGPAATAIALSPDGTLLAEARDAGVSLRRLQDGQVLAVTDAAAADCGALTELRFSPDGSRLLGWNAGGLCVWRTDSAGLVAMESGASRRRR